ncbi:MAG: hypothetical protein QGI68_15385 [Pseudomonadales bacterium]|jgi:acyl-CoA thioesterase|nr:hypothetical protein [Pseudomonadales bacterium]MDP7358604.1 hypothetical protein [Pseudomonadales bacterium]MDP7596932.1 hypothetical protein [Pseudomonadales bacterium]HJN49756.1 hypothetical protein [Pseudomonadales bacterium]
MLTLPVPAYPLDRPRTDNTNNPVWLRFRGPLADNPRLHCCLLAYASDMGPVSTAMLPLREEVDRSNVQMARNYGLPQKETGNV